MNKHKVGDSGLHLLFIQNTRKMTNGEHIRKWLAGELSAAERKQFEATEEFAGIRKLLEATQHFKAPEYDVRGEYSRLNEKIKSTENKSTSDNNRRIDNSRLLSGNKMTADNGSAGENNGMAANNNRAGNKTVSLSERIQSVLKVAAILVIALTAGYFLYHTVLPSAGSRGWITEQPELYLPDSSFVALNAASRIRIAEKKWDEERVVELEGEAFFSVKTGIQFTVRTRQGEVTVLGTEFSVKDREDYFQVTCYAGSVRVVTPQRSTVLQPQSSYRVINGMEENFIYSGGSAPDWFREESSFRSVPLRFVLHELELQYNVSVETKDVDVNQLFTGSFSHKNLDIALKAITIPVDLQYEINENKTVITVEGK